MRQEIGHYFTMTQATFTTETGSKYRVDYVARTCERLTGKSPATARVGSGARRFESITDLQVGAPVLINWGEFSATPSQMEGADPCTLTSHVIKIELDSANIASEILSRDSSAVAPRSQDALEPRGNEICGCGGWPGDPRPGRVCAAHGGSDR